MSSSTPSTAALATVLPHHEDGLIVAGPLDNAAALAVPLDYPAPERLEQQLLTGNPNSAAARIARPWWKRPSPWWALTLAALRLSTIAMQVPAQIDILTRMACKVHRPDLVVELSLPSPTLSLDAVHTAHIPVQRNNFLGVIGELPQWSFDLSDPVTSASNSSHPDEPSAVELCAKDPTVKRVVASILAVLTSTAGILTMITTGWWGQRSDMWGRTTVLAVAVVAMAAGELNLILVAHFGDLIPGKPYWWLLPGSIVLGLLGGGSGTPYTQAYLSDTVEPAKAASIFSIWGGATFAASAIGPIFGGELIKKTGTSLSVYYFSFGVNIVLFILWAFIVPESLDASIREANHRKYEEHLRKAEDDRPKPSSFAGRVAWYLHPAPLLELVTPLGICLPRLRDPEDPSKGRDWNLTYASLAYCLLVIVSGGSIFVIQFMQFEFSWNAVQIGYWVGGLGVVRAVYLMLVLPAIFAWARPKAAAISLPGPEDQLHASEPTSSSIPHARGTPPPTLDLAVVRFSLIGDALTFLACLFAATVRQFVVASMGLALGAGLAPAFMSLALALSPSGSAEGGRLFGAFAVMTSFGAEVLGQWVIGSIFIFTVEVWSRAFLLACSIILVISFGVTLFIRLPRNDALSHSA